MTQTGTISDKKENEQNAFEEALEEVNGTTTKNMTEMGDDTDVEVTTPTISKTHSILFWIIFFLIVVLITIKGVLDLTEVMKLEGQFIEKQYSSKDISELTDILEGKLLAENEKLHSGYRMDMELIDTYQVFTSEDGTTASVFYTVKFRNTTYTVVGYTGMNYFNGLTTLFEYRDTLIKNGDYTWDNSYIPEEDEETPVVIPTTPPTQMPDGTPITDQVDDTDEVIERGDYEEEEE